MSLVKRFRRRISAHADDDAGFETLPLILLFPMILFFFALFVLESHVGMVETQMLGVARSAARTATMVEPDAYPDTYAEYEDAVRKEIRESMDGSKVCPAPVVKAKVVRFEVLKLLRVEVTCASKPMGWTITRTAIVEEVIDKSKAGPPE
jgi:hypothetical protein